MPAAPMPAAPSPAARVESGDPPVIEVDAVVQLGRLETGELVRRIMRVPVTFEDASGKRQTTLTVRLEFRID